MIADCTGLVLAGGESRRMGVDKTALMLDGQTLLQRAIETLRAVFPEVLVSVRELRPDLAMPQVCDDPPGAGPLAGLCAGLAHARTPWVFATAADMPFLDAALIRRLAAYRTPDVQAVVAVVDGVPQPLAAFYATGALTEIRAVLGEPGRRGLRAALERLRVRRVEADALAGIGSGLRGFIDLDTPQDFAAAKTLKGKGSQ